MIFKKIKNYFAPQNIVNIITLNQETKILGENNLISSIKDIENKFIFLNKKKKNIALYNTYATNNYTFLNIYLESPEAIEIKKRLNITIKFYQNIEIVTFCNKEIERLLEINNFLTKLFVLLETLEFRLTEKLNIIKNYDFDNKNNDEVNEKLKILTKKIKTEFELLEEMESSLDYQEEFLLWEQCMKLMKEKK